MEVATWECYECKCSLRPLCSAHALAHSSRGHGVGILAQEGEAAPAALAHARHCPKAEHQGPEGALTHYCTTCTMCVCVRCGLDDHAGVGHGVAPLHGAAEAAAPGLKTALDDAQATRDQLHCAAAEMRAALQQLDGNLAAAEEAVGLNYRTVLAALVEAKATMLAQVHIVYGHKRARLETGLAQVRGAVCELASAFATGALAVASPDPVFQLQAAATLAASMRSCSLGSSAVPRWGVEDPTLAVVVDGGPPSQFQLGSLVTQQGDLEQCQLREAILRSLTEAERRSWAALEATHPQCASAQQAAVVAHREWRSGHLLQAALVRAKDRGQQVATVVECGRESGRRGVVGVSTRLSRRLTTKLNSRVACLVPVFLQALSSPRAS